MPETRCSARALTIPEDRLRAAACCMEFQSAGNFSKLIVGSHPTRALATGCRAASPVPC